MDDAAYKLLTRRERDCLRLAGKGFKAAEIGAQLEISPGHVENVIKRARAKLGGVARHIAARELLAFEEAHFAYLQSLDLSEKVPSQPVEEQLGSVTNDIGARELLDDEEVHSLDVQSLDLPKAAPDRPIEESRPIAGANVVREERATFDWETVSPEHPVAPQRQAGLWTAVAIAALMACIAIWASLAFPVSEGAQHLANLVAPPSHQ